MATRFYPPYVGKYANFVGGTLEQLKAEVQRLDDQDYDECRVDLQELSERLCGDPNYYYEDHHDNAEAKALHDKMTEIEKEQDQLESLQPISS